MIRHEEPFLLSELRAGRLRAAEAVRVALEAAARHVRLNALLRLHATSARVTAKRLDEALARGEAPGPLHGLPLVVKDNLDEAGVVCTGACAAYGDRMPEADAEVVARLRSAGAVILGRANMHELADGVTSENEAFGPVHNPHRAGFHPGGSSGGSAAAVAAGIVPAALGTDTGGSVRIPASLCGVVGLKPTHDLLCTTGVMPLSTSLDHVGVLAGDVPTAAAVLAVLAADPLLEQAPGRSASVLRLGILEGFGQDPDPAVAARFRQACERLEALGHRCRPVPRPPAGLGRSLSLLAAIYPPEAAAWHREALQDRPQGISPAIRQDLERGLRPGAAEKRRAALAEGQILRRAVDHLFERFDLLLSPTTPHPAQPFGSPGPHRYLRYTCPFNLTGHPAISIPMGGVQDRAEHSPGEEAAGLGAEGTSGLGGKETSGLGAEETSGLPVGLQIIAPRGADARLLTFASAVARRL
jgi:aspartyl-tRNA(Asn)/glutamyl-tRNA(Gln) amidotransferase subunit A